MRTFTLVFTEQEISYVLNALAKQPYIEVADLIANIQKQAAENMKPTENAGEQHKSHL